MKKLNNYIFDLNKFLDFYPGMSIAPHCIPGILLKGKFNFRAKVSGKEIIEDSYRLKITISQKFPNSIPKVEEIESKIPRNGDYHVNPDGSLCLGSPFRLLININKYPGIVGFTEKCLIPYLCAVSYKLQKKENFILGELAHGKPGILNDYLSLFGLKKEAEVIQAVNLLGLKKRIANKKQCPCGCGKRLGACSFHHKLNEFRKMAPTSWFKLNNYIN